MDIPLGDTAMQIEYDVLGAENAELRARVAELETIERRARQIREQPPLSDQVRAERRSARYILTGEA